METWLIAIGGALGAVARYAMGLWLPTTNGKFPRGIFIVNLFGCLLLGWLIGAKIGGTWMLLLGTGFCGALTTFSTLQWEIFQLKQQQAYSPLLSYSLATYGGGLILTSLGYWLGLQI